MTCRCFGNHFVESETLTLKKNLFLFRGSFHFCEKGLCELSARIWPFLQPFSIFKLTRRRYGDFVVTAVCGHFSAGVTSDFFHQNFCSVLLVKSSLSKS